MPQIRGSAGPSPVTGTYSKPGNNQTTTVQVGESKLSDVAKRLNLDANALQQANPNISDNLKVGQQINLPEGPAAQAHQDDNDDTAESPSSSHLPPTPLGDPMAKNLMQAKLDASGKDQQTGELHASDLPQAAGGDAAAVSTDKLAKHVPGQMKWTDITTKKAVNEMKWDKSAGEHHGIKGESDFRKDKWIASEASHKDASLTQVPGGDYPSMAEKGEYGKWQKADAAQNEFQKYGKVQAEVKKVDVGESSAKPTAYDLVKNKPA